MPQTFGPIETVHKVEYNDNVALAVQRKPKIFRDTFSYIPETKGKEIQAVELVGKSAAIIDGPHNAPTPNVPPSHAGIWVKPRRITWGRTIPSSTPIKAAVSYDSVYVQEGAAAMNRAEDDILSAAFFGQRLVADQESGLYVATAFDTANQQLAVNYGAGTNTNLTVKKFVGALSKFMDAEIDIDHEMIYCGITGKQNESLYAELQVTSKDYRNKAVFEEKRVMEFMGVRLIQFSALPKQAGTGYRRCPMWVKTGMHMGDPMPLETVFERNIAMQNQPHAFMEQFVCATRSEDEKVIDILCNEA